MVGASPFCLATLVFAQGVRQGVEDLANKLIQNVPKGKQIVLVVSDFPNLQGETCELGRYISARLTTKLSQVTGVQVRERSRLNQVLDELAFSMDVLVDPAKAKQAGKLLGADALVLGEISDLGTTIEIDARVVELETGNTLPGSFTAISKDSLVDSLLTKGCVPPQNRIATAPSSPSVQPIEVATPARASPSLFTNEFLKASIVSFIQSRSKLTAAIQIENTTSAPIQAVHLLVNGGNAPPRANFVGSNGTSCKGVSRKNVSGILASVFDKRDSVREFQTLYPNIPIFVAYNMECDSEERANEYSYSAQYLAIVGDREVPFNISLSGVIPME
jgi:TolB-like protein